MNCISSSRSPHTRGSTDGVIQRNTDTEPFPAHAGINRRRSSGASSSIPVPRTRGDQPGLRSRKSSGHARSPHTRGSTALRLVQLRRGDPFPAHAGINRLPRGPSAPIRSVPRTRGDQPRWRMTTWAPSTRSPHTRGSTGQLPRALDVQAPFPAHAGINRHRVHHPGHVQTVPRTRGDQPPNGHAIGSRPSRSPHTRGSTALASRRGHR